jgi:N-ethylmaleimide reductase
VPFIANPDLVERLRTNASLSKPDPTTFYGVGSKGYTDYPALNALPQLELRTSQPEAAI